MTLRDRAAEAIQQRARAKGGLRKRAREHKFIVVCFIAKPDSAFDATPSRTDGRQSESRVSSVKGVIMFSRDTKRGFATMDREHHREIASKGGKAAHSLGKAHEFTAEQAREAGRKGGLAVSRNRDHMALIGRKGGRAVSADRDHMARIGRKGGTVISEDRRHMAEIGREGGHAAERHSNETEGDGYAAGATPFAEGPRQAG